MLRSIWLLGLYLSFLGLGFAAPFVAALGYVWVDAFRPQEVAYIILNQIPVALIMAAAALGFYLMMDRRSPPPLLGTHLLSIVFAIWCTVTLVWAVAPELGWVKWDWAFKTMVFASFIPFVIRSRIQIEAFAQTFLLSLAANVVPFGAKVLISGGGDGVNLGLQSGNAILSEGGYLSTACLMTIPLSLFLARHSILMPRWKLAALPYWGIAGLAGVTAIGTYQRSALIGLGCLGAWMVIGTKHKVLWMVLGAAVAAVLFYATSAQWSARIATIGDYQNEGSAYTRVLVWYWTLDFVTTSPLGGGFSSFVKSVIVHPPSATSPGGNMEFGRAFHSIYFEVLGEQGWPGIAMFLGIAVSTLWSLQRLARRTRKIPELAWCADFAHAIQAGLVVFLFSGAFVGIAYQPMFWNFVAMGICIRAYVWRVEYQSKAPTAGWRAVAQQGRDAMEGRGGARGWRPATGISVSPVRPITPTRQAP